MLAAERKNIIIEQLQSEKRVLVSVLAQRFEVSEETIRRDLEKLEQEGVCTRSYGGAVYVEQNGTDMSFSLRKGRNSEGKKIIAKILSNRIQDGEHILLDPSTTSVAIAQALSDHMEMTIITNSIEVLVELKDQNGWEVISTGGIMRNRYLALVGPGAIEGFKTYNADRAIISCKGLDLQKGLTDANDMFADVKRTMLESAREKILAVDSTKFDNVAFSSICDLSDLDLVVTDKKPSKEWLDYFEMKGIECLYGEE